MSYEGYVEMLCAKGHYWRHAANDPSAIQDCQHCKLPPTQSNSVDDTNCEEWGKWELKEIAPAKTHQCTCGHVHETEPARFSTTKDKCGVICRTYWDGNKHIPL